MTKYQLTISVEGLSQRNPLLGIRPNPYCKIHITGGPRNGDCLGKSDVVRKSLNPSFTIIYYIETDPSEYLPIKVCIHDDRKFVDDQYDKEIAVANFEITEIYQSKGHLTMQTSNDNDNIKIYASLEESVKGNDFGLFKFHLRGLELKNIEKGLFGLDRSDPYYEIQRKNYDHSVGVVHWNVVYRSDFISNHLNPFWEPGEISLESLCFCDINWPIKLIVHDHNRRKDNESIGEIETTVAEICQKIAIRGNADRETAFKIYKASDANDATVNTKIKKYERHALDVIDSIRGYMVVLNADIITTNPSINITNMKNKIISSSSTSANNKESIANKQGLAIET